MQGSRFDAFTRWTAQRFTRRTAVTQAGVSVAAAFGLTSLGSHPVLAQVATPVPEASPATGVPVSLLFVQYAGPTTLTPGSGDVHTLTMTEVRAQTIYFSDRPNRIAGAEPTATFVDGFAQAFADSPPNASLIGHIERGGQHEEAVVLTLLSAAYDEAAATLTYEVTLLDAELISDRAFEKEPLTVLDVPREYAEVSLFIDDVVVPLGIIPVDRPEGPLCIEDAGVDCSDPNWWIVTPESTCLESPGLELWYSFHVPDEKCSLWAPSLLSYYLFCDVVACRSSGPGPCSGQGTNCCDQACADRGQTSQYATFESCAGTDDCNISTADWSCECAY